MRAHRTRIVPFVLATAASSSGAQAGTPPQQGADETKLSQAVAPMLTANWKADDVWTIPIGLGVTKVAMLGSWPPQLGIQYYQNVHRPPSSGRSPLKLIASLLFPAK